MGMQFLHIETALMLFYIKAVKKILFIEYFF